MAHGLILGMVESGKTTLAKRIAANLKARGRGVIVLDPLTDPEWKADLVFTDLMEFLDIAKRSRSCFLFIDEAGVNCGQWDTESLWLATQSRHWGHSAFFISQRAQQISKTIREQCRFLYLFACSRSDSKILADEWNRPELEQANTLNQGEYYYAPRFGDIKRFRLFKSVKRPKSAKKIGRNDRDLKF